MARTFGRAGLIEFMIELAAVELRTPLTVIKGFAQLLGLSNNREMARGLAEIETAADRMATLVDDLDTAVHLQSRLVLAATREIDLFDLLEEVGGRHGLAVSVDERPQVLADPVLLGRALDRLVRGGRHSRLRVVEGEEAIALRFDRPSSTAAPRTVIGPGVTHAGRIDVMIASVFLEAMGGSLTVEEEDLPILAIRRAPSKP
jgi:hypothetical protein